MKQTLPTTKGFALCDQCYSGPLRDELRKHKAYIRKTYTGNLANYTRDQVRYLAESLGIDLEKYKKGHKSHVTPAKEESEPLSDSDLDDLDLPYISEVPDKFTTFGEQFLSLMEKRPDINRCIQEVLRSKLRTAPPTGPCRQHPSNPINAPNLSIPTVNQPSTPLPHPPAPIHHPIHHLHTPIHPNPPHNFGFPYTIPPTPPATSIHVHHHPIPLTPTPHHAHLPSTSTNLHINFNLHLPNEITNFDVAGFLSDINQAISVSLQKHSTVLLSPTK